MYEIKNVIDVFTYEYEEGDRVPHFEKIQTITSTAPERLSQLTAACAIRLSPEGGLPCIARMQGDNSVSVYRRDPETGVLTMISCLPISGDYPKDIAVFPDEKHLASINHASNSISFFEVDYEKGLLVMCGREYYN